MYENSRTSTSSTIGVACAPQTEQLTNLCNNIEGASREIDSLSERIKSRLFGASPQATEKPNEPCSVEEVLSLAKLTLDSAIKTLVSIDNRI